MATDAITELLDAARLSGLTTTEDGRVVATVQRLDDAGTAYRTELAEIDGDSPVTLTRGASTGSVALAEDGITLFTSKRPGQDGETPGDPQLWALPAHGEARMIASRPGGFGALHLCGARLVAELPVHSRARTEAEHARLTRIRTDAKVTAALHAEFPTRYWDHDLGPARQRLAVADLPDDLFTAPATPDPQAAADDEDATSSVLHFRYLAMPPGRLSDWSADRTGTRALVSMTDSLDGLVGVDRLYLVDLTGQDEPRLVFDATAQTEYSGGPFSPDGTRAVIGQHRTWTQTTSPQTFLQVWSVAGGDPAPLWPGLDRPARPVWLDDNTLVAAGDDSGRGSVWIGAADDPEPRLLAGGPGQRQAFSDLHVAGGRIVAVASGIDTAPHPVQIDPGSGAVTPLPNPADRIVQSGSLTEVGATAADGTPLRAWLRLPDGEGPHPLLVFAHGGPWGTWNSWTFRWNPNPFVARGYAVLMPDPAISTGYGQAMIDRGQQQLGGPPFTDIMALVDAAVARPDIDPARTAFSGGSYGGYMANWVAGHTGDRFRCIITHAGLWDTEAMGHSTDNSGWEESMRVQNRTYNPKDSAAEICVPMLVIHGGRDYRVPISQGHALWYDLNTFSATPRGTDGRTRHRFLYFPDEGHWILGRGNAQVWYETFLAFLDQHVLGRAVEAPATLG